MSLQEIGGDGLDGYIDVWYNTDPTHQHGTSFYSAVFPLVNTPLDNYQIGLPSTWVIPNNDKFKKALCPKGTAAHDWTGVGPIYEDVFQTIEGGLGNWEGMSFPTAAPKFRMGSTADCYTHTFFSECWGYKGTTAMPPNRMGIAQFSNKIVFPPDGITFANNTNGEYLGIAYMPIPMLPKQTKPQPTADQSWTLFFNSANFAGPVAMYIPNYWSDLSQSYATISGRGLDALPGIVDVMAMEVNTVPYFTAQDSKGNTYTRIPRLQFPVDKNGNTILTQGVYFYTADAFYNPLKQALTKKTAIPTTFDASPTVAMQPTGTQDPLSFAQTSNKLPIIGIDTTVQTYAGSAADSSQYGLHWTATHSTGYMPQYYVQQGKNMVAISESAVPVETQLQQQTFATATTGAAYQPPSNLATNKYWNNWVKAQPAVNVTLNDGSVVTYRWYRFVDQPSIAGLNLTNAQKTALQSKVEQLHQAWAEQAPFMPKLPAGNLVTLDSALLVNPPKGLEYGYVPIVLSQSPDPSHAQTFMFTAQKTARHKPKPKPNHNPSGSTTLTQGECGFIDTQYLPSNGQLVIDFPGCTKVTIYQAFESNAAQAVWNANQGSNPLFAPTPPTNPKRSSLMVITNALGQVEVMSPFPMGLQLALSNNPITGGSEYYLSGKLPGYTNQAIFMNLKSPDVSVQIPNSVYGGSASTCTTLTSVQKVQLGVTTQDYITPTSQKRLALA